MCLNLVSVCYPISDIRLLCSSNLSQSWFIAFMTSIQTFNAIDVVDLRLDATPAYPGTLSNSTISRPISSYISRSRKDIAFIFSNFVMHILKQLLTKFHATTLQIADFRFLTYKIFDLRIGAITKFSACTTNISRSRSSISTILGNLTHQYLKQLLTNFQIKTLQFQNFYTSTWLDLHAPSFSQIFGV